MFESHQHPLQLQADLELFIQHWHAPRAPWFGVSAEKLKQSRLPQPLSWLYGFAGSWPGAHYWSTLLGNQDCLLPFEELSLRDGKLVFISENQGIWQVGTEPEGEDPPVFVSLDGQPWAPLDSSLSRFLVTFVLHETLFGCTHLKSCKSVSDRLRVAGMQLIPLWLDHPYPFVCDSPQSLRFHVANGRYLVMNDEWCATNEEQPWLELPGIFDPPPHRSASMRIDLHLPLPDHLQVPAMMRAQHLRNLIAQHAEAMDYHQQRIELYRQMLVGLDGCDELGN